jgi:transcriptional regulator of arginine metabolism
MTAARKHRRERIIELVAHHRVTSQEQLQEMLRDEGIRATQATISRDLRDLCITKGPSGYVRMTLDELSDADMDRLREAMQQDVQSLSPAGTLLVLRTTPGRATDLASLIESAQIPQCIGVIAGDDSIFVATRSVGQASELARMLQYLTRYETAEAV